MASEIRWLGLADNKVKETTTNAALTALLKKIVDLAKSFEASNGCSTASEVIENKQKGNFLYQLGTKLKPQSHHHLPLLIKHIINGNIRNDAQFKAAIDYLLVNSVGSAAVSAQLDEDLFKKSCGVGVIITADEIEDQVKTIVDKHKRDLLVDRYSYNIGKILADTKVALPWADGAAVKKEVDMQVLLLLGTKTEEELNPKPKKKAPTPAKKSVVAEKNSQLINGTAKEQKLVVSQEEEGAESMEELLKTRAQFHKVGENFKTVGYEITPHTMHLLEEHVKAVQGKVTTRFPPEPNGILHIGHAKAININFGFAKSQGGRCILRFDDTNPEKEEEKFFTAIEEAVKWLGYTPYKITHSSDYFDQLYKWAVELVEKDLAYVCHQNVEDMRGLDAKPSPWRTRPVQESLQLFQQMKNGVFDEGQATLRLKLTLEEGKMDPVAYRIKFVPHHRTKDKWCVYPTYDYTHCLCDSIENITHSLCTKEFQSRRSSYYWLCNSLNIYCPVQWEYARLNVSYTVVSKRKILKLVEAGKVSNWDDPRLFTLPALRRRGIPAEAVNAFVAKLGLTVAQTAIQPSMLDSVVRDYLNNTAPRTMVVLDPLQVQIDNYPELGLPDFLDVPHFPANPNCKKVYHIAFGQIIYIEKEDYTPESEKSYRRLTNCQSVGLKHIGLVLHFKAAQKNQHGIVEKIVVTAEKLGESSTKPKAFIHWVAEPVNCEVRLYEPLFKHKNPEDTVVVPEGFLSDCNDNTIKVLSNALMDASVADAKQYDRFQFERTGYFCVDGDSSRHKLVFNRTVLLKEDSGKN